MRILHLVSYYPPDRIGGVGEVVAHLHRELLDRGHDSWVLTTGRSRDDPRVIRRGVGPSGYSVSSLQGMRMLPNLDIIHAQHGEAAGLLGLARLRRDRPRIVLTLHVSNRMIARSFRPYWVDGKRYSAGGSGWVHRWLKSPVKMAQDRFGMSLADEVTFIARSGAREVVGAEVGAEATVIYNALPNLPRLGLQRNSNEILFVGTASHRKRTQLLPLILDRVRAAFPLVRLRLAGFDLADQRSIQREFAERGLLDAVTCEGPLPSEDVAALYASANLLVVPSAYEGLPMVILEAARGGTPTVATAVGGAAEFIQEGKTGLLVDPDNVGAIASACERLLADPALARRMGRAAEQEVRERFEIGTQVDRYLEVYERAIANV